MGSTEKKTGEIVPKPTIPNKRRRTNKNTPIIIDPKFAGGELRFSVPKDPEHGTATPTKTGNNIIYTPDKGFTGDDTFTYKATNKQGIESNEATIIVTVTASCFFSFLRNPFPTGEAYSEDKPINNPEVGVPEVKQFLRIWKDKATILRSLQVLLGTLSIFFSLLTTTVIQFNSPDYNTDAKIFAFIAAVSIGLMTAFDLGTKSNNMTNAWRHLNAAVIKFNNGVSPRKEVIDAYIDGELTIGNVTFQPQGTDTGVKRSNNKK